MARRRIGFTITEVAVATVLITVLLVVVAQTMALVAQQRRNSQYHLIASEEAANMVELLMAYSFDQLTAEAAKSAKFSPPARDALPSASLRIEILPTDERPRCKRVTVEIAWATRGEEKTRPIRVVAWKYDQEGGLR